MTFDTRSCLHFRGLSYSRFRSTLVTATYTCTANSITKSSRSTGSPSEPPTWEDFEITHDLRVNVVDAEGPPPPILTRVCSGETGVEVAWRRNNAKYDYELERRPLRTSVGTPTWTDTLIDTEFNLPIDTTWVFRVRAIDKATGEQSKWSSEEAVFVGGAANTSPKFRRELFEYEVLEEQPAGVHVGYAVARDEDRYSSPTVPNS